MRHREVKRVVEMVPRRELKQDKRPRSASAGRDPQASKWLKDKDAAGVSVIEIVLLHFVLAYFTRMEKTNLSFENSSST